MSRLVVTETALSDIDYILEYTEKNWGDEQRQKKLTRLSNTFEKLSRNPRLAKKVNRPSTHASKIPHLPFVILYEYRDDVIKILQIIHDRQNRS